MVITRPAELFDREAEWEDLSRFMARRGTRLGIVWGPRRVGKSFLLQAFSEQVGGQYIQAVRQDPSLAMESLGQFLGDRVQAPAPLRLDSWQSAMSALLDLPGNRLVVIDEFPYFIEASPELPTVVQAAIDQAGTGDSRLVLCGSAISQMTSLLAADGPLFRRAGVSLAVRPFDLRTAVRFWDLPDRPVDAMTVHAIVGGIPGYRDVLGPVDGSVAEWIVRHVLDPSMAVFHEDELVFAADPALPDANVYRSILTAIVAGHRTPTGVAQVTGRKVTSLVRPIDRLVDTGVVTRTPDPLRAKRSLLDIEDPFLRFHYAIIRPNRAALARRRASDVWERTADRFRSQVLGPHFEVACRDAVLDYDFGLPAVAEVGATTVSDPAARVAHEIDIVGADEHGRIVLIGEAKASRSPRGVDDLSRLDRLASLLPPSRRPPRVHLAIFALSGVDDELRRAARRRDDVSVIDAAELCHG